MAIEGALQDVSLADICQLLGMGMKTGCLSMTDRSNFGYIYFEKGRIIYASVLNRRDRLGELLVRNHVITRKDLSEAIEAQQSTSKGKRLGEVLVEQGALSGDDLKKYIQLQIEEAVYHLFTWQQGSFHFDPDQMPDEEGIYLVSIPAEALLMEGARRVDEWSQIEKKIPSLDVVFQLDKNPDESSEDVELTKDQKRILPYIDGVRTVTEILNEAGLVEFDTGKALYGLIQAGFVSRSGERSTQEETGGDEALQQHLNVGIAFYRSGMFEDAEREFEQALGMDPKQARANFMMGLIAFRRGKLEESLQHFGSMAPGSGDYSIHRNTALALELMGRYDDALRELDAALVARPDDHEVHLARAVVHLKGRNVKAAMEALRAYRTSSKVKKPAARYYAYTVLASAVAGDLEYAVAVGREGMGHYPESGPILVNTAAVLERRGEVDAASALYKRAIALTPPMPQAHKNLGDQAYAHGDLVGAQTQYEKAVKLSPRLGDDVYLRLGTLAYKGNDRDMALLLWRRAIDLNPHNETVRTNLEMLASE